MLNQALQFLLQNLVNLFLIALLLRFYMQWARVPFRNPFAHFVVKLTDFAVRPLRRVIPGLFGVDMGTLLLALVLEFVLLLVLFGLDGYPFVAAGSKVLPGFLLLATVRLSSLAVYTLIGLVVVMAVLSMVNPLSPLMPVFAALAAPLLRPFRRLIPLVANFDLSPLVFLLVCQLVIMLPLAWLEHVARSMM
ncbi:MAG TPA: YggT family protein [Sulfuriferula sp.]|nr:YggT family protein [Sulfuriferula sp.]